jgi:nucleotide-binding universal stress UspA family protein
MTLPLATSDPVNHAPSRLPGPIVAAVGESGQHVLRAAAALAPIVKERVLVLSAIEPSPVEIVDGEPFLVPPDLADGRRESRVEELSAGLAEVRADEHRWQVEVGHGEPVSMLVRRARELDASLIVVGIGRLRPVDRLLGGETTLDVVRYASAPVLAVGGKFERRPREVVVATDFSSGSMSAARAALPWLARGTTLHVVHVWEPKETEPADGSVDKLYSRSITARLVRFVSDLRTPSDVSVRMAVREGRSATQLIAYARENTADLIVAGRTGTDGTRRLVVGSVTEALLMGATCSVLVVPERDADRSASDN